MVKLEIVKLMSSCFFLAGVLKSFFQDLPEPLLTHDLYPMLLDAYSVQIEEDPGGNADLMFGIIDCLPLAKLVSASAANFMRFFIVVKPITLSDEP